MIFRKLFLSVVILSLSASNALAIKGVIATEEDKIRLKQAIRDGEIQVGITRLKDVVHLYGEAENVTDTERRITYDFGDFRVEFDKDKLWRDWQYDSFENVVYTEDVDQLRYDLESEELVGDNISFKSIVKSYGEPTKKHETTADGVKSIYYYGNIKMTFENYMTVRSWRVSNFTQPEAQGVLGSSLIK